MKIKLPLTTTLLFALLYSDTIAQNAGKQTFLSLTFPVSSHIASLGGQDLGSWNNESAYFFQNPATLDVRNSNSFFFNYTPLSGKIQNSVAGFSHTFKKNRSVALGIQFLDYGIFENTDEQGYDLGETFYGKDFAISAAYSNKLTTKINYGASVKYAYSKIESYQATGIAMDAGFIFQDTTNGLIIGAAIKNAGVVAKDFTETSKSNLPFDIQAGISQHLIHTPFTIFLNLHDLNKFDIRYPSAEAQQQLIVDSTDLKVKKYTIDKIFRHANFGLQIDAGKNLKLNVSYNHQRGQELGFDVRKSLAGFSCGLQLNIKKINFGYSYSVYNISGGQNNLTIAFNIKDFASVRKM